MEVVGAGFGRTGTLSLKEALEELGFPCYHMKECVMRGGEHDKFWLAASRGEKKPEEYATFLLSHGFTACVDWPTTLVWKDLYKTSPKSKVILTIRDPESWYESLKDTAYSRGTSAPLIFRILRKIHLAMVFNVIWINTFKNRFSDREYAIEIYKKHIEEVKATVDKDRLLVYEIKDGWEPLCRFLNKPIPNKPFPNINSRKEFHEKIDSVIRSTNIISVVAVTVLIGGGWLLFKMYQRHQ